MMKKDGLRSEIISVMEYLSEQSGKEILIIDRLSTNKETYDRHFTTTSRLTFKLKHFGVRFSGGIAMLEGENQSFEFRTDTIKEISRIDNKIDLTVKLRENVFRKLEIEVRSESNGY